MKTWEAIKAAEEGKKMRNAESESFEETYKHVKGYLNRTDTGNAIALLHDMCANCERWNGIKEHDYSECKDMACFKLFLRAEHDEWCASFEGDGR